MSPIYLDHNATTPVDPAVLDAILSYLRGEFGNPSSAHGLGGRAHPVTLIPSNNKTATCANFIPSSFNTATD